MSAPNIELAYTIEKINVRYINCVKKDLTFADLCQSTLPYKIIWHDPELGKIQTS